MMPDPHLHLTPSEHTMLARIKHQTDQGGLRHSVVLSESRRAIRITDRLTGLGLIESRHVGESGTLAFCITEAGCARL